MGTILLYTIYVMEETVKCWFVYSGILNLKTTKEREKYFYVFLILLSTVIINVCFFDMNYSAMLIISRFFCVGLLVQCDWKTKTLAFIPTYLVINFMDTTIITVIGWILQFNPLFTLETGDLENRLSRLLPSFILLGSFTFLNRNRKKKINIKNVTRLQYLIISFGLLCSALLTSFVTYMIFNDNVWELYWFKSWFTIVAMESIVTLILFILYIKELMEKQKVQNEMLLLYEKRNLLQKEYYQRLYEQSEKLKRFQHDYHHHLYSLRELLRNKKYDEAVEYIRQLGEKTLNHKIDIVYSGNTVVDAVIYGVLGNTEIQNIKFDYKGKLKKKIGIEDVDICTLLANALENAVEACGRYHGNRYIRMEIATYKSNVFITISNPYPYNSQQFQKRLRTEKEEREYHGYGIQNMKAVAEKYNGNLSYEVKDEKWILKIHLEEKETT